MTPSSARSEMNARPHPNPLPRREGTATQVSRIFNAVHFARRLTTILPLLGERAGVRADVNTNLLFA
jgi:hypothetical protein